MNLGTKATARQVAFELCNIQSEPNPPAHTGSTSLIFPSYWPSALNDSFRARVSEAEARVIYCLALEKQKLPYAVEVPTTQKYTFSGTTKLSARSDLVVYASQPGSPQTLIRDLAIEFKAHNPRVEAIRKDLEKLLREPCNGLWFHILKNADTRTIPVLFEKFDVAIRELRDLWQECDHSVAICAVVMQKKFWLYRTLTPSDDLTPDLSIDYEVKRKRVIVKDARGWVFEAF